jgi:DNA-binding MarR family transcriptional regulator
VHRLARRGLIECLSDPADGRGVRVALSEAGRAAQRAIGRQHARSVANAMTAVLSHSELSQLEVICRKLSGQPVTVPAASDVQEGLR